MIDLAVVILTKNEEANLPFALASVCGWAREVYVFDSFSTDGTERIAREAGAVFVSNAFRDYSQQRNDALRLLPIRSGWTMFLDADEQLDEALKQEIASQIERGEHDAFRLRFKMLWRGQWIRRGYFGTWVLRVFRTGHARTDDRGVNEHQIVDGRVGNLSRPLIHEDHNGLERWLLKHIDYAKREALRARTEERPGIASLLSNQADRKNWVRWALWQRLPVPVRASALFGKRMMFDFAFLDGPKAIEYHFLQALWFQMVVGAFEQEAREHGVAGATPPARGDERGT